MKADINEWFDQDRFRADANAFIKRQRLRVEDIARIMDMNPLAPINFLQHKNDVTLRTAAALAMACDLSLDAYVLTQSQHDQYVDDRARMIRASLRVLDMSEIDVKPVSKLAPRPSFWRER